LLQNNFFKVILYYEKDSTSNSKIKKHLNFAFLKNKNQKT
jgi:hypothetical protein